VHTAPGDATRDKKMSKNYQSRVVYHHVYNVYAIAYFFLVYVVYLVIY
jgi:hypothetical protein